MNGNRADRWAPRGERTRRISSSGLVIAGLLVALSGCRPSARRIAEDLAKSILFVETFDAEGKPLGQGTAFFITPETALTNMHVMKWAKTLKLSSPARGISFDVAAVVGVNFDRDLCVLRVASKEGRPLRFASKGSVAIGDKVYVAGNPKGLTGTVSTGIVSSIREQAHLIQIDAPISPGSSGGPVVSERGEVVGVATLSLVAGQNLNFAVETLGGLELRTVDWSVADVGKVALSDLEIGFLKGPVKSARELRFLNGFEIISDARSYTREGMWTSCEITTGETTVYKRTYFDARIPSSETRDGTTNRFDYAGGLRIRTDEILFGVPSGKGGHVFRHDAYGRIVSHETPDGRHDTEYDDDGKRRSETRWRNGKEYSRTNFRYEFDGYGNWTVARDQLGETVWRREIEYFSEEELAPHR